MALPPYTRGLRQTATYWAPGVNDGFGGVSYLSPTVIRCRWQEASELFRDQSGDQVVSNAVVYVDSVLETRGYLALGDLTDEQNYMHPTLIEGAREIRQVGSSPSLSASVQLNKVYL